MTPDQAAELLLYVKVTGCCLCIQAVTFVAFVLVFAAEKCITAIVEARRLAEQKE